MQFQQWLCFARNRGDDEICVRSVTMKVLYATLLRRFNFRRHCNDEGMLAEIVATTKFSTEVRWRKIVMQNCGDGWVFYRIWRTTICLTTLRILNGHAATTEFYTKLQQRQNFRRSCSGDWILSEMPANTASFMETQRMFNCERNFDGDCISYWLATTTVFYTKNWNDGGIVDGM